MPNSDSSPVVVSERNCGFLAVKDKVVFVKAVKEYGEEEVYRQLTLTCILVGRGEGVNDQIHSLVGLPLLTAA